MEEKNNTPEIQHDQSPPTQQPGAEKPPDDLQPTEFSAESLDSKTDNELPQATDTEQTAQLTEGQAALQHDTIDGLFPSSSEPASEASAAESPESLSQTPESIAVIRALLIKFLLGSVIAAAVVAVVAILAGSFGEVAWRAIGTIVSAIVHIGILFAVVSNSSSGDPRSIPSTNLVINIAMTIAILSFFTSIFWIWEIIGSSLSSKLFVTYAVVLFAILHTKTLFDMGIINQKLKPYVAANYVAIATVATLILGVVYLPAELELLSTFYGRLLAAAVVIDVTLGIVIAVMQKLYLQKHPDSQEEHSRRSGLLGIIPLILGLALFFFIVLPLLVFSLSI